MKIKKYTAHSMSEAMKLIKDDLGPDAVIVSSERAPRKNIKDFFNPRPLLITAAVEDRPEQVLPVEPRKKEIRADDTDEFRLPAASAVYRTQAELIGESSSRGSNPHYPREPVIPQNVTPARLPEPILNSGSGEKDGWFQMLVQDMVNQVEGVVNMQDITKWKKILENLEIRHKIIENILPDLETIPDNGLADTEELIQVLLKNNIAKLVGDAYKKIDSKRVMTFIGPTGVGKTTTLVKIATRYQVFRGKSIALIALYDHRFGALEELQYYAEIMKAPVEIVMTPGELNAAVNKHRDKDYIFIDTEGRPSRNTGQVLELKGFLEAVEEDQDIILVLSATTKDRDITRIIKDFGRVGISKLVFTKLDETDTLGSILNAVCETGVPVGYVTNGQNIPDDIEVLNPKKLAGIIFEGFDLSEDNEF